MGFQKFALINTGQTPKNILPVNLRNAPVMPPSKLPNGYLQKGPLSIDTDTATKTPTPGDPHHQDRLPAGSPGNTSSPGAVAPQEATGVKMGDPAILRANGQSVDCIVFDRSTGNSHRNKPEVNSAAAEAVGLDVKPGPQGPYPSAGKGDAAVPAEIYFPTAQ
jgi:hypothetical protein